MSRYREDMRLAWDRINAVPAGRLETRFGTIEYTEKGQGVPLLVCHGVLGCHVDGVDGWWSTMPGPGFRIIAPSRFWVLRFVAAARCHCGRPGGCLRLAARPSWDRPCGRAGVSAGSGSVLEFGLRHPDRVIGLILANCRLGGGVTMSKRFAPALRLAYGADRLFWIFKKLMPTAFSQMMGVPKGYRPTPEEARVMAGLRELLFPLRPRREGRSSTASSPIWLPTGSHWSSWGSPRWSSAPGMIRWRRTGSPPGRRRASAGHGW